MNPKSGYSDHWFFGNGMVHGINIQNGKASYKNRYVKTPYYEDDMDMMSSSFDLKPHLPILMLFDMQVKY